MSEEKKWYVMRVISGKERKVKEYIEKQNVTTSDDDFKISE